MEEKTRTSRRSFLKATGAVAVTGAGALAALRTPAAQAQTQGPGVPAKWDEEADVVIVGFGGAGASAAIAGHDAGAEMLILEVAPKQWRGGNTTCSGGGWVVPYDKTKYLTYLKKLCFGATKDEFLADWVETDAGVIDWMTKLGFKFKLRIHDYGHFFTTSEGNVGGMEITGVGAGVSKDSGIDQYQLVDTNGRLVNGKGLFALFANEVEKRKIRALYETRATELVQNVETREILGVKAKDGSGKEIAIRARRGVILACGGFENNPELQDSHIIPGVRSYPAGTPYNRGDGVYMAQKVGADIFHMAGIEWVGYGFKPTESDVATWGTFTNLGSGIIVNKYGKRIYGESRNLTHTKTFPAIEFDGWPDDPTSLSDFKGVPSFLIFDEAKRLAGPLQLPGGMGYIPSHGVYTWSQDNLKEVNSGLIKKADTIEELATKVGIDPAALAETVKKFNGCASAGQDLEFGRDKKTMKPIEKPPYYGVQLVLAYINTQGGPKHSNKDGKVLDRENNVIPRLYAAGECGSVYSMMYHGSGNIPEALMVGKLAAENAAKEKPWVTG
jgi:succinate dehydrogenase/fumarate reductase flavoprotein subunit